MAEAKTTQPCQDRSKITFWNVCFQNRLESFTKQAKNIQPLYTNISGALLQQNNMILYLFWGRASNRNRKFTLVWVLGLISWPDASFEMLPYAATISCNLRQAPWFHMQYVCRACWPPADPPISCDRGTQTPESRTRAGRLTTGHHHWDPHHTHTGTHTLIHTHTR